MEVKMFEQSLTISEKMQYFEEGVSVDYSALTEWRDCRTLLNDRYFMVIIAMVVKGFLSL